MTAAQPSGRVDLWGRAMPEVSSDSLAATRHVMNLMRPSPLISNQRFLRLDLTDPLQHRFFMDRFGEVEGQPLGPHFPTRAELAAHLARPHVASAPLRRPMLHMLSTAPAPGTFAPTALIAVFNYDNSGPAYSTVTAGGIISIPGGFVLTDALMEVYDGATASGPPIAAGSGSAYGTYAVTANATGMLTHAQDQATALFSGHYTDSQQTVPFAVAQTIGPQPPVSIAVGDPIHKVTQPGQPITVAIGRMPSSPPGPQDTDYYLWPGHPLSAVELLLSVDGSATSRSPNITFVGGQTVTGSLVLLKTQGASPGGGTVVFPGNIGAGCAAAGLGLSWNFNSSSTYGAVTDFGQNAPWSPGDVILLNLNLTAVMNTPSGQEQVTIAVTSDQSGTLSGKQVGNTYFIDALQFYWGCVAGHSLVRLADGSERPLRAVRRGDRVAGAAGRVWVVARCTIGVEDEPLVELETERGARVSVTEGHPVLTPNGPRIARSLRSGDTVVTERGPQRVVRVIRSHSAEPVFNLALVSESGASPLGAAFFAGGVLVGDERMQAAVEREANEAASRAALEAMMTTARAAWVGEVAGSELRLP